MMSSFIDKMVEYYSLRSDGDPLFMKFATAQLLGFLLGKNSYVDVTPDTEQLNFYTLFVAESYYGRKNVAQDIIKDFYPMDKILPNETSSEKFISNLEKNPDGIWFAGEFSKILKHINKGHYLSDIAETLNDIYNYKYPVYRREIMKQEYQIEAPFPQFNSTLTHDVIREQVSTEMMGGGLFGRMLLVPGKASNAEKGRSRIPEQALTMKSVLQSIVDTIYTHDIHKKGVHFVFSSEALEELNRIEKKLARNKTIRAVAGRYGQAIIKLSAITHFSRLLSVNNSKISIISNNSNSSKLRPARRKYDITTITINTIFTNNTILTISLEDLKEAFDMVKPCIEYAEMLYDFVSMNKKHIIKVREYVKENHPVTKSDVSRYCNLDAMQLKGAEDTLWGSQDILRIVKFQRIKKNGTKAKIQFVYCMEDVDRTKCQNCEWADRCDIDD